MVAKCIKNFINDKHTTELFNGNMRERLKIGHDYVVYGIRISKITTYYTVFTGEHLLEVPSPMFEIIDGKLPPNLIASRCDLLSDLLLWPPLFYEEDFFENFSDWQEPERKAFEELRKKMDHAA